ncbi:unnamed protein product [Lupinus luteus]|uniref:Holocarboxylase synthetase n=1 Tax=Lupinus luteus TaxID=3873 RepID=A0AAV1Y3W3_LUPLU
MAKKRKSVATSLDEVDRTMYASFCSAANSLSQLYTHAMNHQKLSFHAGERHALEKLNQWIWRQQEEGSRVSPVDVINYIQNELDYCGEEQSTSPRAPLQQQQSQAVMHVPSSDNQPKNSVFSNALSSPVRRSLHQAGNHSRVLGNRNTEPDFLHQQSRDSVTFSSNDSAMDMHAD